MELSSVPYQNHLVVKELDLETGLSYVMAMDKSTFEVTIKCSNGEQATLTRRNVNYCSDQEPLTIVAGCNKATLKRNLTALGDNETRVVQSLSQALLDLQNNRSKQIAWLSDELGVVEHSILVALGMQQQPNHRRMSQFFKSAPDFTIGHQVALACH